MPRIISKIAESGRLHEVPAFPATAKPVYTWVCMLRVFLAVLVCIAMIASPCAAASSKPLSFNDACKKIEKLSKDASSARAQWLEVIDALVLMHVTGKPASVAKRSLFQAGKACLALYRVSGKPEDLDRAVKYLSDFNRYCRKGPYLIPSLQALKEADTLKRELEAKKTCEPAPVPEPKPQVNAQAEHEKLESPQYLGQQHDYVPRAATVTAIGPKAESEPQRPANDRIYGGSSHGKPSLPDPRTFTGKAPTTTHVAALNKDSVSDVTSSAEKRRTRGKEFVVVIDPGHGGRDPGAVSRDGFLKEKDLTLEVSKRLKTALERKNRRIKVTLTRNDDRSMALQERTALANSLNADLFISVHCNADTDASSKGIETFFLDKASSPRAMRVAARENGIPLSKMSDLQATLLDLMITSKKTESMELASTVQSALAKSLERTSFSVRNRGIKQAPFYVLLGAKMPAILVECAFISNNRDQKKLASPEHLANIAEGLASGAALYLRSLGQEG